MSNIDDVMENLDKQLEDFNKEEPNETPNGAAVEEVAPELDPNAGPLDELADDEPLFDGGPTKVVVEGWKAKYPHSQIRATLLADGSGVIWRTLNRMEWKKVTELVRAIQDQEQREEVIFSKVVLHPDCKDTTIIGQLPAGALTAVMNEFYLYAGFQPVAESLRL